ncbi:dehydrin DHN1-like [Gastrolobium bilobum]|uniref:dehydrin DHN1-like n=1 Tax=Gastrolobium bilobum TaxID=150636 RepID=UPI002AAF1834|nr:dehydrin DHN1-like [Gastrolobium bilobum]
MAHYQNQYGAVPISKDSVQKEMETAGDTTGVGGGTQVLSDEYGIGRATADSTSGVGGASYATDENEHHHKKKGIMEKIKEKLPGTHHHNN